mgnify:FL=1|jgi:hypothetical protein
MQFFRYQNARKIEELLKKYLNEQKYALFFDAALAVPCRNLYYGRTLR